MRKCINNTRGQAIVEYMVMLMVTLFVVGFIASTFKRTVIGVWQFYTRRIAAPCPSCPPDPSLRLR